MIEVTVCGIGAWGPGFENWHDLREILRRSGSVPAQTGVKDPPAQRLPLRERRRAPLLVRLAVETAGQAASASAVDAADAVTVFASAMGDVHITDYMCRTLTGDKSLLSPTQFHNSVHNAPAGYWSIATGNQAPGNSVSAFCHSFANGLIEAAAYCRFENIPVLLVVADLETNLPFDAICRIDASAAVAMMLIPGTGNTPEQTRLQLDILPVKAIAGSNQRSDSCARHPLGPLQGGMEILRLLANSSRGVVQLPAGSGCQLQVTSL